MKDYVQFLHLSVFKDRIIEACGSDAYYELDKRYALRNKIKKAREVLDARKSWLRKSYIGFNIYSHGRIIYQHIDEEYKHIPFVEL